MACLRMTLLRVRPGMTAEAQGLLQDLEDSFAGSQGLLMSFVTEMEGGRLGRFALWHSKEDANYEATRDHVLAVRARLRHLSLDTQELLMDVKAGHVPQTFNQLLAGEFDPGTASEPIVTEVA